jgi:hypothetical protein
VSFDLAKRVADAVLYEGYVLYPYRASAVKNQVRWQFGVAVPRGYGEAGGGEPWASQTECLIEAGPEPELDLRVRFLQVQARTVERALPDGVSFQTVPGLDIEGCEWLPWEEGVERQEDLSGIRLDGLRQELVHALDVPGGREAEGIHDARGRLAGRVVRERWPASGLVRISASDAGGVLKLRVRVENTTPWQAHGVERHVALRQSFVSLHVLLALRGAAFVSLLDPPQHARAAAESCQNLNTWPVLIGPEGRRDVVLSSPIILYDYPAVAPESPGDLCDSTEIDEILTLRVLTLTDEEKRAARATDERARRILDRSESLTPQELERLHGTLRRPRPQEPDDAFVFVGARRVAKGSRVRLLPRRRADTMDLFLKERSARVEGVFHDVDDQAYVAVTVDDDPAADLHGWYGRYFYFYPDEIEPLEPLPDVGRG